MLPPSPQHYAPRFSQPPPLHTLSQAPTPPPPPPQKDARSMPPGPNRPGSSMSISSMLGFDADKGRQDQPAHRTTSHSSSTSAPTMSLGAVMSPPQYTSRAGIVGEYPPPRSQTPDRPRNMDGLGSRPYRSSSGSMIQRPAPFDEIRPASTAMLAHQTHSNFPSQQPLSASYVDEAAERHRRTSLSGILQRPSSQPQPAPEPNPSPVFHHGSYWPHSDPAHGDRGINSGTNGFANGNGYRNGTTENKSDARHNPDSRSYDTRPPMSIPKAPSFVVQSIEPTPRLNNDRMASQASSPEARRSLLAGILNGPSNGPATEPTSMARQDSTQSQGDRFIDRLDWTRPRFRSPFASSYMQQGASATSAPPEEQGRKGSDELSHHRAILGLANEFKRGRYSPLPQAVQGAQAQTPIPDSGIKSEHGRVFAGLGSGIGTGSNGLAPGPPGLSASPFKRDDGLPRLSEDNLMKISRSTPGTQKRPRKFKDDDTRGASDPDARGTKKAKNHHHSGLQPAEKLDLENLSQRNTPLTGLGELRRTSTPTAGASQNHNRLHHHHRIPAQSSTPVSRQRPVVKISHILKAASHRPRRHLGFYVYSPTISAKDPDLRDETTTPSISFGPSSKRQISVRPSLLPIFSDPDHLNCTYTIRVSRHWLRYAEREVIRSERRLWGIGVYTDDSDPVAAAMHAGFIKPSFAKDVDVHQLGEISRLYDPLIEGGQENVPVDGAVEPPPDRDCHITLLVLPRLECYQGRGRFGIVSRSWGGRRRSAGTEGGEGEPHDGVSFMVLNAKFVDEGRLERGRGRSGAARKGVLRADMEDRLRARERLDGGRKSAEKGKKGA